MSRRHWLLQVVVATSGSRQTVAAISHRFPSSSLLGSVRMVDSSAVMGTMRFSNHRGLKPSDVQVTGNTMAAKLTRSKTTGDVKDVAFRMVHISSCCLLSAPSWLSTGWALRKVSQTFQKTFFYQLLLPTAAVVFRKISGTTSAERCRTEFCHPCGSQTRTV